jgi:hypothetical protein
VSLTQALNVGTVFGWILVFRKMTIKDAKGVFMHYLITIIFLPLTNQDVILHGVSFFPPIFLVSQIGDHPQED